MNGKPWTPADDTLRVPDLQKSVADAIRRRLRKL